jgi:oligoendopeptidase F
MGRVLDKMLDCGLYNIDPSSDKSKQGYTCDLHTNADHFIYNCPSSGSGSFYNLQTMWHEFGHYYYGTVTQEKHGYIGWGSEDLVEIESIGLTCLSHSAIDSFDWSALQKKGYFDQIIYHQIGRAVASGIVTSFERYCYTTSDTLTPELLDSKWSQLTTEFGMPYLYHYSTIMHLYADPCYYISYGTSTVPALELFMKSEQEGMTSAFAIYQKLVDATNNGGFKTTLSQVGLSNPFSSNIITAIANFLTSTYYS